LLLPLAAPHSWLHCTSHNNTGIRADMAAAAAESPYREVDPLMPWYASLCAGWPRAKQNPGDWVNESTHYIWDLQRAKKAGDTQVCPPSQRTTLQYPTPSPSTSDPKLQHHTAPAPMATARAGTSIKLMYGGNGHSRGSFGGHETGDAGRVGVYWAGGPEREIVHIQDLSSRFLMQENGFSEKSFAWPPDGRVTAPPALKDKG
ncbi:hypothetical protein EJ02DRAFT_312253, partial [Clathrospora elynae]